MKRYPKPNPAVLLAAFTRSLTFSSDMCGFMGANLNHLIWWVGSEMGWLNPSPPSLLHLWSDTKGLVRSKSVKMDCLQTYAFMLSWQNYVSKLRSTRHSQSQRMVCCLWQNAALGCGVLVAFIVCCIVRFFSFYGFRVKKYCCWKAQFW